MGRRKPKLGDILVSEGYITERELKQALSEQRVKLGEVLFQATGFGSSKEGLWEIGCDTEGAGTLNGRRH